MEVIHLNDPKEHQLPPLAMAIGYFDGVHLGHQQVIGKAKEIAIENGWKSAVMFFHPSPKEVLGKNGDDVRYITLLDEKIQQIERLGIDYSFVVPFTREFAQKSPETFVEEYIVGLNVQHVIAGFDFTYGKFGKGNMETLKIHSRGRFGQTAVGAVTMNGQKISSTYIRRLIKEGNVSEVPKYLGRFFSHRAQVIPGKQRGKKLGFPTANLDIDPRYILPEKYGVYAARLFVKGRWYDGVLNIGTNPTFNEVAERPFVEIYLFDFSDTIYGEQVILEWHKFQREELKFTDVSDLITQMERDEKEARDYFTRLRA
ncbi:MAG: riboflavin biosynthesis protein RibF [Caldibacillus sp.]